MNINFFKNKLKSATSLACALTAAVSLNGCGGGFGDDVFIAPETLDETTLILFGAFQVDFFRLSGDDGNEAGGADYTSITQTFNFGQTDGSGGIATSVVIPALLNNVTYTYVRNSQDTGTITLSWTNPQAYPFATATPGNNLVQGFDIFWGGRNFTQTSLTIDVLFAQSNGSISSTTSVLRSFQFYNSIFTGNATTGSESFTVTASDVETLTANFSIAGSALPSGFSVDIDDDTPSSAVFENLQGRIIDFTGGNVPETIGNQSTSGGLLDIPGEDFIEDSGTVLVQSAVDGVTGGSGDFAYVRTGGADALLLLEFDLPDGTQREILYTLTFTSTEGGTYVTDDGFSGTFLEELSVNF